MSDTTFIYGLVDPITKKLRYIGKADDPMRRLDSHLRTRRGQRGQWIQSLVNGGHRPIVVSIQDVPKDEWQEWERYWIALARESGENLLNVADGGEGDYPMLGRKHSLETRAKMRAAAMGRKNSPESRAKMSIARRGKKLSVEHRKKLSDAGRGKKHGPLSPEHRTKLLAANVGRKQSVIHVAKRVEARRGYKHSPETRAKIGAANHVALRGKKHSAETRTKMSITQKEIQSDWAEEQHDKETQITNITVAR